MKLDDYKELYRKLEISEEMDERIRRGIMDKKGKMMIKPAMKTACVAAAAIALIVGALQIPVVSATAEQLIARFTGQVVIHKEDGSDMKVDLAGADDNKYVKIKEDARKEDCKMDSLRQAEKELGVTLLKSKDAVEEKNCITYTAYTSKKGVLNGVMLMNDFYAMGDLQNVKTTVFEDVEDVNSVSYRSGKEYHSPIKMQILVRSDNKEGVSYEDHELEYAGISEERSVGNNGVQAVTLYEIKRLGVKAVITTVETDGPHAWRIEDGKITSCTDALFVYKGVEYRYIGTVSHEVMEEFLEGLAE